MGWPTPQDYNEAIQNPQYAFLDSELQAGEPTLTSLGLPRPITGNFASVYCLECGARHWAVRCFLKDFQDQKTRYSLIGSYLGSVQMPYTVGFKFLDQGIRIRNSWYPVLKMEWVQGETLDKFVGDHLSDSTMLGSLATRWVRMIAELEKANLAHGDLQHGNVLIVNNDFKLIDYDGMYVPPFAGRFATSHELGDPNYQHPRRTGYDFDSRLDRFSAWVIYLSLVALSEDPHLWRKTDGGIDHLLLRGEDLKNPQSSLLFNLLQRKTSGETAALTKQVLSLLSQDPLSLPSLAQERYKSAGAGWLTGYTDLGRPDTVIRTDTAGASSATTASQEQRMDTAVSPPQAAEAVPAGSAWLADAAEIRAVGSREAGAGSRESGSGSRESGGGSRPETVPASGASWLPSAAAQEVASTSRESSGSRESGSSAVPGPPQGAASWLPGAGDLAPDLVASVPVALVHGADSDRVAADSDGAAVPTAMGLPGAEGLELRQTATERQPLREHGSSAEQGTRPSGGAEPEHRTRAAAPVLQQEEAGAPALYAARPAAPPPTGDAPGYPSAGHVRGPGPSGEVSSTIWLKSAADLRASLAYERQSAGGALAAQGQALPQSADATLAIQYQAELAPMAAPREHATTQARQRAVHFAVRAVPYRLLAAVSLFASGVLAAGLPLPAGSLLFHMALVAPLLVLLNILVVWLSYRSHSARGTVMGIRRSLAQEQSALTDLTKEIATAEATLQDLSAQYDGARARLYGLRTAAPQQLVLAIEQINQQRNLSVQDIDYQLAEAARLAERSERQLGDLQRIDRDLLIISREEAGLARARLHTLRAQSEQVFLQQHPLQRAGLPEIPDSLCRILQALGVRTAADITREWLETMPELDGTQALALLRWKRLTTTAARAQVPTSLPQAELDAIKQPLAGRRNALLAERDEAVQRHASQKAAIQSRYKAERVRLEVEAFQANAEANRKIADAMDEFDVTRIDYELDVLQTRFIQQADSLSDRLVRSKQAQAGHAQRVQALKNELESYDWLTFKRFASFVYLSE